MALTHLPAVVNRDLGFGFEVLQFLEHSGSSHYSAQLFEKLLEGARTPDDFIISTDRFEFALKAGVSGLVSELPIATRALLITQVLDAAKRTPHTLSRAMPTLCNLITSLKKLELPQSISSKLLRGIIEALQEIAVPNFLGQEVSAAYEEPLQQLFAHIRKELPDLGAALIVRVGAYDAPFDEVVMRALRNTAIYPDANFANLVRQRFLEFLNSNPRGAIQLLISLKALEIQIDQPLSSREQNSVATKCRRALTYYPYAAPNSPLSDLLKALNHPQASDKRTEFVAALEHFKLAERSIERRLWLKPWSNARLISKISQLTSLRPGSSYRIAAACGFELPAILLLSGADRLPAGVSPAQELAIMAFHGLLQKEPDTAEAITANILEPVFPSLPKSRSLLIKLLLAEARAAHPRDTYLALLALSARHRAGSPKSAGVVQNDLELFTKSLDKTEFSGTSVNYQVETLEHLRKTPQVFGVRVSKPQIYFDWLGLPQNLIDEHSASNSPAAGGFWTHCFANIKAPTFHELFGNHATANVKAKDPLIILSSYLGNIATRGPLSRLVGSGELAELREYSPGDSIARIDQRSLARHDRLLTKHYREREATSVVFLVDIEWLAEEVPKWHAIGKAPRLFELALRHRLCKNDDRPSRVIFHFRGRPIVLESFTDYTFSSAGLTPKWWRNPEPQFKNGSLDMDRIVLAAHAIAEYRFSERSIGVEKFPWHPGLAAKDLGLENFPAQATVYLLNSAVNAMYSTVFERAALRKGASFVRWKAT